MFGTRWRLFGSLGIPVAEAMQPESGPAGRRATPHRTRIAATRSLVRPSSRATRARLCRLCISWYTAAWISGHPRQALPLAVAPDDLGVRGRPAAARAAAGRRRHPGPPQLPAGRGVADPAQPSHIAGVHRAGPVLGQDLRRELDADQPAAASRRRHPPASQATPGAVTGTKCRSRRSEANGPAASLPPMRRQPVKVAANPTTACGGASATTRTRPTSSSGCSTLTGAWRNAHHGSFPAGPTSKQRPLRSCLLVGDRPSALW